MIAPYRRMQHCSQELRPSPRQSCTDRPSRRDRIPMNLPSSSSLSTCVAAERLVHSGHDTYGSLQVDTCMEQFREHSISSAMCVVARTLYSVHVSVCVCTHVHVHACVCVCVCVCVCAHAHLPMSPACILATCRVCVLLTSMQTACIRSPPVIHNNRVLHGRLVV